MLDYLNPIDYKTPEFGELYDELPLWSAPFGLMLLDQVPMRPGVTILDVGAGTGFLTIELAQRCGASSNVIAIDPWEAAMKRLERKAQFLGIANVRLIVKDVAAMELPAESVDLIVSNLGINNFENREAALAACFRAAKPGADLYLTTNLVGHFAEFYEVYREALTELGFVDRIAVLDAHISHRATIDSVRALLEGQGFQFIGATTRTFLQRFVDGSALLRHYFMRLGFVGGWKSIAPESAVEATFVALEKRLNEVAAKRGELALSVPAACIHARKP